MVRFLGSTSSVDAILDKLHSSYGSESIFDAMMQGFYRENQGRSKSVVHYIARLEGKLNKIPVKHPNRVSEGETAGYIRDHLFYGLRKPLQEVIHAKFDNPMNDYMTLVQAARKAEGEHKYRKDNNSCTSKSGVVSDVPVGHEGNANPNPEAPTQEPWANRVEMQQQLMVTVTGTQNMPKRTS